MSQEEQFKRYCQCFPTSTKTFEQWKVEEKTIRITPEIEQYLLDIIYESAIGVSDYPNFATKVKALLDWTVQQGLQTEAEKAEVESEF